MDNGHPAVLRIFFTVTLETSAPLAPRRGAGPNRKFPIRWRGSFRGPGSCRFGLTLRARTRRRRTRDRHVFHGMAGRPSFGHPGACMIPNPVQFPRAFAGRVDVLRGYRGREPGNGVRPNGLRDNRPVSGDPAVAGKQVPWRSSRKSAWGDSPPFVMVSSAGRVPAEDDIREGVSWHGSRGLRRSGAESVASHPVPSTVCVVFGLP